MPIKKSTTLKNGRKALEGKEKLNGKNSKSLSNKSGQKEKSIVEDKDLTIYDLPNEWDELNERQKEILIKNYPLKGIYKISVFFFPGIFLIYSRNGILLVLMILISSLSQVEQIGKLAIIVLLFIRIRICIKWESICYSESINMKKTLIENENKRNTKLENYDDSAIIGHVSIRWKLLFAFIVLLICLIIGLIIFGM